MLKSKITGDDLKEITSPKLCNILKTIKSIQKRMKDPDVSNLDYIRIYDKLGKEFEDFFDKYTKIFTKVIRGDDLNIVISALYYKDKIDRGLMNESELSEMLAEKYLQPDLKKDSDAKIKEMREKGEI